MDRRNPALLVGDDDDEVAARLTRAAAGQLAEPRNRRRHFGRDQASSRGAGGGGRRRRTAGGVRARTDNSLRARGRGGTAAIRRGSGRRGCGGRDGRSLRRTGRAIAPGRNDLASGRRPRRTHHTRGDAHRNTHPRIRRIQNSPRRGRRIRRRRGRGGRVRSRAADTARENLAQEVGPINPPHPALPIEPGHLIGGQRETEAQPAVLRGGVTRRRPITFAHHQTPRGRPRHAQPVTPGTPGKRRRPASSRRTDPANRTPARRARPSRSPPQGIRQPSAGRPRERPKVPAPGGRGDRTDQNAPAE